MCIPYVIYQQTDVTTARPTLTEKAKDHKEEEKKEEKAKEENMREKENKVKEEEIIKENKVKEEKGKKSEEEEEEEHDQYEVCHIYTLTDTLVSFEETSGRSFKCYGNSNGAKYTHAL